MQIDTSLAGKIYLYGEKDNKTNHTRMTQKKVKQ